MDCTVSMAGWDEFQDHDECGWYEAISEVVRQIKMALFLSLVKFDFIQSTMLTCRGFIR